MNQELERLKLVASQHFKNLSNMASMFGKNRQFFYSYSNQTGFGRQILKELEEKLGINPRYIQYGEEPMMSKDIYPPMTPVKVLSGTMADMIRDLDLKNMSIYQMEELKQVMEEKIKIINKHIEVAHE